MILLAALLAGTASTDLATILKCPEWIQTEQVLVSAHPGWESRRQTAPNGNLGQLAGFAASDDPKTVLQPIRHRASKGSSTTAWQLDPDRPHWVICGYSGSSVVLMRPLPKGLVECTITTWGARMPATAGCKWQATESGMEPVDPRDREWLRLIRLAEGADCAVKFLSRADRIIGFNSYHSETWRVETCRGEMKYHVGFYPKEAFPKRKVEFEIAPVVPSPPASDK